jgi:rubrerythrin
MTDESKKRTEAMQRAAECRERAAHYDVLADEAKQRGDNEMSANFASSAYEERNEARRIEEGIGKFIEQKSAPARSRR